MRYKGTNVTLDTYQRVFGDFKPDVLDEIRASIMDGVELGNFIDRYKDDPFILQQIRSSMKASVPEWMLSIPYPVVMRETRELYIQGVNVYAVERLVTEGVGLTLDEAYWSTAIELIKSGAVIPEWLKLEDIPSNLLSLTRWSIVNGHDVEGIVTRAGITPEYAMLCLKIRIKGQDVTEFVFNQWNIGVLEALEKVSNKPYYGHIVRLLDGRSVPETVNELIALGSKGFPFHDHDLKNFNSMQLSWIYQAHMEQLDFSKMLDTNLSQRELVTIYNDLYLMNKGTTYLL